MHLVRRALLRADLSRKQAVIDQPLLALVQEPRQFHRKIARLDDDRRDHEDPDADDGANDGEIDHEDRGPARDLLPHQTFAFDGVDERGEPDGHERADIDEHQRITDFPQRPADADRERQTDECVTD